jgi:hypothetical protein
MLPFKDTGRLSRLEFNYNMKLSAARCTAERAFALLKSRFWRFKGPDLSRAEWIPEDVIACCILQILCLALADDEDIETTLDTCSGLESVQESNSYNESCDRKSCS